MISYVKVLTSFATIYNRLSYITIHMTIVTIIIKHIWFTHNARNLPYKPKAIHSNLKNLKKIV